MRKDEGLNPPRFGGIVDFVNTRIGMAGIWLGLAVGTACAAEQVRVTADRVNLRTRAELESEQVGNVNEGDVLTVIARHGDWIEVAPPTNLAFWVHRDFLEGSMVNTRKLNVRSGPSINHSIVGQLAKGDPVGVRGNFGEWVEIGPPPGASVFVFGELVEPVLPAGPLPLPPPVEPLSPPETSGSLPAPTLPDFLPPEAPALEEAAAAPPPDLNLLPLDGQGRGVQMEGEVKRTPWLMRAGTSPYRLIRREGNQIQTLCFIRGNTLQLESLLDQALIVHGRAYWVEGADYPVVVVRQFEKRALR